MQVFLGIVLVGGFFYWAYWYSKKLERERLEAFQQFAEQLKFDYLGDAPDAPGDTDDAALYLYTHGKNQKTTHLIQGRTETLTVSMFDYKYITGAGKNKQAYQQTVVAFEWHEPIFPRMGMRPYTFTRKVGASVFGGNRTIFESFPAFQKHYWVDGNDPDYLQQWLTLSMMEYFVDRPGWCVEMDGQVVLIYQEMITQEAKNFQSFFDQCFAMFSMFKQRAIPE
ncbi:hypothetical protein [Tuwongella immobilis]|uniref:Uncharacterized protein n=1 Tax=Tuwongella immobilis TaxID=692036 RepID=A0A6C2YN54_9BACT|nr:hypothetical protein [Tuwongella immobilis]VIP02553.1 Uncharacterized protein OS=Microcystis aeruginosa PCC 9807 GN=MICAF_3850009 PE=4 SV=1 [Tuwongella immobilis]VTS01748.1 Uncharacterized protein OS=Microcystis aeruginosa PCC 9807 GN=MICAF_3850009 PE=4 SV=1 [Tuwongella immobilis]